MDSQAASGEAVQDRTGEPRVYRLGGNCSFGRVPQGSVAPNRVAFDHFAEPMKQRFSLDISAGKAVRRLAEQRHVTTVVDAEVQGDEVTRYPGGGTGLQVGRRYPGERGPIGENVRLAEREAVRIVGKLRS